MWKGEGSARVYVHNSEKRKTVKREKLSNEKNCQKRKKVKREKQSKEKKMEKKVV